MFRHRGPTALVDVLALFVRAAETGCREARTAGPTENSTAVSRATVAVNVNTRQSRVRWRSIPMGIGSGTALRARPAQLAMSNATVAAQYGLESLFRVDSSLLLLIFGLAAALGVVSGVAPARKAASVDPVEVLRES